MSLARRYKRKKEQDVKKMYEKQMRTMSTMTDEQKVTHLHHLSSRIKPNINNQVAAIGPVNVV
jgi:hypothetical protein